MNKYYVVPDKDATAWYVKIENVAPVEEYDKKDKAIEAGEKIAQENKPSSLIILDNNHETEDERNFK